MPDQHDCKLYQRTFRCRTAQWRHIRTSHLKKSTFHCRECFYFSNRCDTCVRHYKIYHSELEYDKRQVYEVKTADSLPFANQQQPNTSRHAKQVLTYKYKEHARSHSQRPGWRSHHHQSFYIHIKITLGRSPPIPPRF